MFMLAARVLCCLLRLCSFRDRIMSEHSRLSPAAALREARRKKILENSTNRLKLIEGINSSFKNSSTESLPQPKSNPDISDTNNDVLLGRFSSELNSKLSDIIKSNNEFEEIPDFLPQFNLKPNDSENLTEESKPISKSQESVGSVTERNINFYFDLLLQKKLHYVMLAITVNILFFFNVGYLFYENIFCPFYTVKAIEILTKVREKDDFQPLLYLVVAGLPKNIQKFTKIIITVCVALLSDLCIYLFTFVIGTKIINN